MKWRIPGFRRIRLAAVREAYAAFGHALRGQRGPIALALLVSILVVALDTLGPWPIKVVFDVVLDPKARHRGLAVLGHRFEAAEALALCCGALVLIVALGALLRRAGAILSAQVGRRVTTRIRRQLYDHVHRLSLPFHLSHRTGDLLVRLMGDVNLIRDLLFQSWIHLLQRGLTFIALTGVMLAVDPLLAAAALAPLPLLGISLRRSSRRLRAISRKQREKEGGTAAFAAETLRQIRLVKASGAEAAATQAFARGSRSGEREGVRATRVSAGMALRAEVLSALGLALVVLLGAQRVLAGTLTAGELWVFVAYARSLYKPLRGLSKEGVRLGRASACADRLLDLLRTPPEPAGTGVRAPAFAGAIAVRELRHAYEGGRAALRGISLEVPAGGLALLSGPNGSGKSTLLALLLRFFEPASGRLLVDGTPIDAFELASYRSRFAYVPQDIQLFGTSVRENILFGRPDASEAEVEAAARAALVHDAIMRLPEGYETGLGEGGATLSGGEARRVMLARAALRDARILLLDEPLAGIDADVRPLVAQAIRRIAAGRTTVVVSHEPAEEIDPELVFVMEDGQVVQRIDRRASRVAV